MWPLQLKAGGKDTRISSRVVPVRFINDCRMSHHDQHCEICARDDRRAEVLSAAVEIIGIEDDRLEGFEELRAAAVKVVQKVFDAELLPKGMSL